MVFGRRRGRGFFLLFSVLYRGIQKKRNDRYLDGLACLFFDSIAGQAREAASAKCGIEGRHFRRKRHL